MYAQIRQFFADRDVLEVETPIFSRYGNTDPAIASIMADFSSDLSSSPEIRYAHTSPEFPMKRLLVKNAGAIYQICKVFRKEEIGRLHNPEFSMLEWYRPGLNYNQLMDEISELIKYLGIAQNVKRISYAELFQMHLDLDVLNTSVAQLKQCAKENGLESVGFGENYDDWTALLLANLIEPKLGFDEPVFVYDYPASQAALSQIREKDNVAERFELYIQGIEIANGYQELTDVKIYERRFETDNEKRKVSGLPEILMDKWLLNDLLSGLPNSSGVAMGLDRLLMIKTDATHIDQTLTFSFTDI